MARKAQKTQESSSDDDAPEVVSKSTSKADAKRDQKALQVIEAEERARRKARNRKRDETLKERARVTKGGKGKESKGVQFVDRPLEGEDEGENDDGGDDVEARMLRAMRDAAGEMSDEEEEDDDDDDDEFKSFGDDGTSDSDSSFEQDEDDENAGMSLGESDSIDPEAPTDDEEMDEDDTTLLQANTRRPIKNANYLADDLFAAAFASQSSKPPSKKTVETTQEKPFKKRRRKSVARAKDLVIGGRTIRTLPCVSDPQSQATARSVPSERARRFVEQSLAIKGKRALSMAKKRGWERRPANIGVRRYQGAPHGFARSTR